MEWNYPPARKVIDVLLVEPDRDLADRLQASFDSSDFAMRIHIVSNGADAMDFIHRRGDSMGVPSPDFVLLDPELPDPTGFEILSELKNEPKLKQIPVIVLSESDDEENIVRSYSLHANAFVRKRRGAEWLETFVRSFESFWLRFARLPPKLG